MDQILAHIKDRKNGMRNLLTNEAVYCLPNLKDCSIEYSPENLLEDLEWFYLDLFSQRTYCPEFVKMPINNTAYPSINLDEMDRISYICSIQEGNYYCFQGITKTNLLKRKCLILGDPVKYNSDTREIVCKEYPDAIYCKDDDRLYFKKLASITSIFQGIIELYREATEEETQEFLAQDFIILGDNFSSIEVKQLNRKRIALAKKELENYDLEQKEAILNSIREYCPNIINDDRTFKIDSDNKLTYLLYGILQRYFTTADGREKRIAKAIQPLKL